MEKVPKIYLKTWNVMGYDYLIYRVDAGNDSWLEANPVTKGVTRTAEDENILRILLQNDVKNMLKFQQRVK